MADKRAEPLLAELKTKPDDPVLLAKVGNIYFATRNYSEACTYYQRSVDLKDDPALRVELGRAYFYAGNADSALGQFERVLKTDPANANAMFNIGMIKWQSKFDPDGAIAAWQQILKKHPNHPRRAEVEKLIARARQHRNLKPGAKAGAPAP
jgi:cytochrome c-type biogenesis protein CcmH/NrfG